MKILLLVDGNAILHRAFYALPPFKSKDGTPTNAVYGFLTMLLKAVNDFKPEFITVCFDTPAPTFRKKLFKQYQAHRPKIDDKLKVQMTIVREMLDKAGITRVEKEGFEADDLIGTIVHKAKNKGIRILILSGDKDILQLVDKNIFVISPQVGLSKVKLFDVDKVKKEFGINASQIVDFKALSGDTSDNYTGAKGIGPKTASQLINKYGSLDNLFKLLKKIKKEKIKKTLEENKKSIILAQKLAIILNDVPINFKIDDSQFKGFHYDLKPFLQNLGMKSLVKRVFSSERVNQDWYNRSKKSDLKNSSILSGQQSLF